MIRSEQTRLYIAVADFVMLPLLGSEQTRLYVAVADFVTLFRFLAEAAFVVPCEQHFCPPCLFGKEFKNISA